MIPGTDNMSEFRDIKNSEINIDTLRQKVTILTEENIDGNVYIVLNNDQIKNIISEFIVLDVVMADFFDNMKSKNAI